MVETDWREILSFSQKELMQADKEKLCESLSWMEADDIELNFTDLKSLFRLSQDILKYKSEQVNNLMGQLETSRRKSGKKKVKSRAAETPTKSPDVETVAHQDEIIKANKETLEQLRLDIAELEGKKSKLDAESSHIDKDSESSRDPLSEMNEVNQLENEITMKNRHIRKLLTDVKSLEDDGTQLKEKVSVLKEKLTEASELIENLTQQILTNNNEYIQIKDALGRSEKSKAKLTIEIESLKKELLEKNTSKDTFYEDVKLKALEWKNLARSKKNEAQAKSLENLKLREELEHVIKNMKKSPNEKSSEHDTMRDLQEKLSEASNEILQSVNLIELLKVENRQLKLSIEDTHDAISVSDAKNESDDGKERALINKLKKRVKILTMNLQGAEKMITDREKELSEITSQLQLVRSDEGLSALLDGIKNKKRQLRIKDEGIKSLVKEVNLLNQIVNDLQLENETMRQKLNIPKDEKIHTQGIMKNYKQLEKNNTELAAKLRSVENKLVSVELHCRDYKSRVSRLIKTLNDLGYSEDNMPLDGSGDAKISTSKPNDYKDLFEENEGLRKGLQEILQFLKDNSTTSSGLLAVQCPSLEAILHSLDARHSAGWYSPHMSAVMEAKAATGGKDALLIALHEARKETFDALTQLSKETVKSQELQKKLLDATKKSELTESISYDFNTGEFGTWISEEEQIDVDFHDKSKIETYVNKGNLMYENQLRQALTFFYNKFKELYSRMNVFSIQAIDDQNNFFVKEEQYKAQIENLKAQIELHEENDRSEDSPGLVTCVNQNFLQRKCSYLEETYKYFRTLNENMKTEYVESKREAMILKTEYENNIQKLILSVANLTDKLRNSINIDFFWKQNETLNDVATKYRNLLNKITSDHNNSIDLQKRLENERIDILKYLDSYQADCRSKTDNADVKRMLSNVENSVLQRQLEQTCEEILEKKKEIENLQSIITNLQEKQSKLIDKTLSSHSQQEFDLMASQLKKNVMENQILKEQCQHIEKQLDIALLQLQDSQQRQMSNDIEINMLRHQILDLQSTGDNKAIVARLSGEVLVAHLQSSESHKKIERLNTALHDEKQTRAEIEELMHARQKIFDVYSFRYESKFRYMHEVMQILRQQYQGALPVTSLENYFNNIHDLSRKTKVVNDKLDEIEDLRSELITKHSLYDQILDINKTKCLEEDSCSHKLKYIVMEKMLAREKDHSLKKIQVLEVSREQLTKNCNDLEKTLLLVNQGFEKANFDGAIERKSSISRNSIGQLELEDINSDDEQISRKSKTITLPNPQIIKNAKNIDVNSESYSHDKPDTTAKPNITKTTIDVFVQTTAIESYKTDKTTQTDDDQEIDELKQSNDKLRRDVEKKSHEFSDIILISNKLNDEITALKQERAGLGSKIERFKETELRRDGIIERLNSENDELRSQINQMINSHHNEKKNDSNEERESFLKALQQLESDKNTIVNDYKQLLQNERDEYSKAVKDLHVKLMEAQTQLDRKGSDSNTSNTEALKEVVGKYSNKITELGNHSFKLQSDLDNCRTELTTYQSEAVRWKELALERLSKMEQLKYQVEERHNTEVDSYKAENQHWLSQLGDVQRSHLELRNRLTEQKTVHVKQIAEKDSQIEQFRTIIYNLKTQIMNMQTMLAVNDPSFDLSAIIEVEEASDVTSNCDKLELRFDSTTDVNDIHDELVKIPATSTTIWQEPIIERLRREKQLALKQNAILRRQIKALAARERRSRLDAQNLKNQIFRISTSGRTPTTAETAALHSKVASLQEQLTSARRETHSGLALWDKWKRAQQAADRWQARYEDRCQEIKKLETSLNYTKSAVSRLEREKRVLLVRQNELKDKKALSLEKQEEEPSEKYQSEISCGCSESPVSTRALLDRVEAQQRRIVALETAERGNELLVSEYERSLAEITTLKGQVLKLESTLLESQIRMPLKLKDDLPPELEYFKNYCEMLKEENLQLTMKVNSLETTPISASQHRVNDLEQTVLTLRGLVSKLQAEQKTSGAVVRKVESRPGSGRSYTDKFKNSFAVPQNLNSKVTSTGASAPSQAVHYCAGAEYTPAKSRNHQESYRTEIVNLKRSIQDKDLLLERSKEMLKIAAEREDELLRENAYLRRKLEELSRSKGGFLSA